MIHRNLSKALGASIMVAALAGCGGEREEEAELSPNEIEAPANGSAAEGGAGDAAAAEMPPMVVRTPAYRCDDGNALYVDVLSDENAVNVRDSRQDVPILLERSEAGEPFTGQDRSLSGTGDEVRYSAPERPDQTCRAADV